MTNDQYVGIITVILLSAFFVTGAIGSAIWMVGSELDKTIRGKR